jgi:hypothetical protein
MNFKSLATGLGVLALASTLYVASKTTLTDEDDYGCKEGEMVWHGECVPSPCDKDSCSDDQKHPLCSPISKTEYKCIAETIEKAVQNSIEATAAAITETQGTSLKVELAAQLIDEVHLKESVVVKAWNDTLRDYNDNRKTYTFWFAAKTLPPKAAGQKLLGECGAGACSVQPLLSGARAAKWSYEIVGQLGDWKLGKVTAAPYFANGLKEWAANDVDAVFLGSPQRVKAACLAHFTALQCSTLLPNASDCWALFDAEGALDRTCMHGRYGSLPGTHEDLGQPCSPTDGQAWVPIDCVTSKGPRGAIEDAKKDWSEEEL